MTQLGRKSRAMAKDGWLKEGKGAGKRGHTTSVRLDVCKIAANLSAK
jgi:hypothetical protein